MLRVTQTGGDAVIAKLDGIERGLGDLTEPTKQAVLYVHSQIPPYPPPPSTSRYRRTGTLGRSLTSMGSASGPALSRVEGAGSQVVGYVGTAVEYAPQVIGAGTQQLPWRNYWWTLQGVVAKSQDGIRRIYEAFVGKLVK